MYLGRPTRSTLELYRYVDRVGLTGITPKLTTSPHHIPTGIEKSPADALRHALKNRFTIRVRLASD